MIPRSVVVGLATVVLSLVTIASLGCVTVEEPRGRDDARRSADGRPSIDGPVARPVDSAVTRNARVVVGVKTVGSIRFDGQQLPLFSPDGRYAATQTGEAPQWPTLLAGSGQTIEPRSTIAAYDVTASPPRRLALAEAVPAGSLLGRSADDAGFLIERVTPTGERVVERVSWLSGKRRPVSSSGEGLVAAHGTLMPEPPGSEAPVARAVWSERSLAEATAGLAAPGGQVRREAGVRLMLPTAAARPDVVYAVAQRDDGAVGSTLVALSLRDAASPALRSVTLARAPIGNSSDPSVAYQAFAALQTPLPASMNGVEGVTPPGFVFFHPQRRRMAVFDSFTGAATLLAEESSAAAWHVERGSRGRLIWGLFVTTSEGLVYQGLRVGEGEGRTLVASEPAPVLSESFVVRLTSDPDWPYILVGPDRRDPRSLVVLRMRTAG